MKSFRKFLFSSVGESWEKLPYSKSKSTKSYTNKYLVFKGLCLLDSEVPSVFPQAWTLQGRVWKYAHQMLGLGKQEPLLIIGKKRQKFWGTVILALCLFVPPGWNHLLQVPLVPVQAQHGVPMCVGGSDFDSHKTKLSLTSPTSWRSCRPSVQVRGWDSCDGDYTELLLRSQEAWVQVLVLWPWES